ncbi:sesquipedalian-1-like isoform X2 [Chironomus tepperi]|uniref:sesquipedalian-1-like isoform X2 n=1 Tax=Chironomus tepperi TaxID=113505 RepID=UPI00391F8499
MKINEKNLYTFANSKPVDREGYLYFKRDTKFNKRWFVLKGNLLFYFEKKGDKEPLGLLLLEGCTVELSAEEESQQYCFQIQFMTPGDIRTYYMSADCQTSMESWMKSITCASYDYMKLMVAELQRQLEEIDNRNKNQTLNKNEPKTPVKPPRQRQNPFNKLPSSSNQSSHSAAELEVRRPTIWQVLYDTSDYSINTDVL